MATASSMTERQTKRRWRFRYSIRSLMAFVALVSMGLSAFVTYFADAQIDGNVRFGACACGLTSATIADGKVVLAEANHDTPAGTIVATIEIEDRICTLRRFGKDGIPGTAERLQVDHLGAKYYAPEIYGEQPVYVLMVDNWKLYPAYVVAWIKGMFR